MDPEHVSASHGRLPTAIEALYPVPPLSWLAPLWAYVCGVIASPATTGISALAASRSAGAWQGGSVLLFMLGLLLAGPLLGIAWAASGQIRFSGVLAADAPEAAPNKPFAAIPFTIPGSASSRLASWLGAVAARWQRAAPSLGMTLLRLAGSTIFSLAVAAALGQRTLIITMAALLCVYARSLVRGPRVARHPPSEDEGAARHVLDVFLPILLTWLLGHATFAALRAESVLVAACFALVLGLCSQIYQVGKGLLRLLLPQIVVIVYFITSKQPLTAAALTLLASSQLLWSPLLEKATSRTKYFRATQLPLAAAMLLAAWTLGHGL